MELNGRIAVITGGSGGIGRAMARAFLDEGAGGVMLADLDAARPGLARAVSSLSAKGLVEVAPPHSS